MAHVDELRTIQPDELPDVRDQLGNEILGVPIEHEHRHTDTADKRASLIHRAESPTCGYVRETRLGFLEDADDELQDVLDSERQTVADVIERGNVVEFCENCFPELAAWNEESNQ